jgi:hypothetical protein
VDIVDETFVVAAPKAVAAAFADPASWRRLWPDLRIEVYLDRGDQGLRWTVRGALVGTMEVWLEPMLDGTLLHYFLRADLPPGQDSTDPRRIARERRNRQLATRRITLGLKMLIEQGRPPGVPPESA